MMPARMADWTAITGIVVSGVVGPTVIAFWAWRRQASESKHQIALADRAAGRVLLDEAARDIREVVGTGGSLRSAVITWGTKLGREGGKDEWDAFRLAARKVDLLGPRVTVMFGPESDVMEAFAACLDQINRVARAANMIPQMEAAGVGEARESFDDVEQGLEEPNAAHGRFLQAGHHAVGVR